MKISEAADLIRTEQLSGITGKQTWCDLGCGTGTFTLALATLLPPGSTIYAIDRNEDALAEIPERYEEVTIRKQVVDWNPDLQTLPMLDGILMANLLHFMEDQVAVLAKIRTLAERLVIVEYERETKSQYVPYPISFSELQALLLKQGFTQIREIGRRPSRYGGDLYASIAE